MMATETPVTDLDLQEKRPRKPPGDPDSSGDDGGRGRRGRHQNPITINKWAKPLPRLDLPARLHLQKASKIKQIWELWSVNVALAMSTWNDIAVTFWHQVYTQSEDSYLQWRRSGMATGLHMRRGISMEGKHQSQRHVMPSRLYFDMNC